LSQSRHSKKSRRRLSTKLTVAIVTGICSVTAAIISAYAHPAEDLSQIPVASNTEHATVEPSTPPSVRRSSSAFTAVPSSSQAGPTSPVTPPPKPTPTIIQPSPPQTLHATPTTSPTTAIGQSGITVEINVIGPCIAFSTSDVCFPPLDLTLQPLVLDNGEPILGNCQVNWTIVRDGSTIFQKSSSCEDEFDTGLVLEVGNYEIIAEGATGSGEDKYSYLILYVENAPGGVHSRDAVNGHFALPRLKNGPAEAVPRLVRTGL
jgi:hypothetical protein